MAVRVAAKATQTAQLDLRPMYHGSTQDPSQFLFYQRKRRRRRSSNDRKLEVEENEIFSPAQCEKKVYQAP